MSEFGYAIVLISAILTGLMFLSYMVKCRQINPSIKNSIIVFTVLYLVIASMLLIMLLIKLQLVLGSIGL